MDSQNYDVANAYFQRGLAKAELGKYEEAIAEWNEVIRLYPDAYTYDNRGLAKANLGRYEEATADYDEAIRLDPTHAVAYDRRGIAKANLGRYEEAIVDYDETIRLNPTDAGAYVRRAEAKAELGRYEEAIADNDEAIKLNLLHAVVYVRRGAFKATLSRYEEAITDYDEGIRLDPTYGVAYNDRGWAKAQLGRHEEAIADYDEAIRLDPTDAVVYNNRGVTKAQLGRYEDAITDYDEAIRLDPGFDFAYDRRNEAKETLGRNSEASENHDQNPQFEGGASDTSQPNATSSIIVRPNQEAMIRALNIYRDTMRPFMLDTLVHSYGASGLMDAITSSFSDEQASNFERDLERKEGNIAATLDVNHFRPIVEHHWDSVFFARFGYDQSMLGTLGWVTRARNDAAHPGTADIAGQDVESHFSNILKVLERIGAAEGVKVVEEIAQQLDNLTAAPQMNVSQVQVGVANSICGNIRCQSLNQFQHPVSETGRAIVECLRCNKQYTVSTFTVMSSEGRYDPHRGINAYVWRTRFANGEETVVEYYHSLNVTLDRNDMVTASLDQDENLVYLVNENVGLWWYFAIGVSPKRSWWGSSPRTHYTGCYSALSRFVANSFYDPNAGFFDRLVSRTLAHLLMAITGHPQIPPAGRIR